MSRTSRIIIGVVVVIIILHAYIQSILNEPIFFRHNNNNITENFFDPKDIKEELMNYIQHNKQFPPMEPHHLNRTRDFGVKEQHAYPSPYPHSANFFSEETDLSKFFTEVGGPAEHNNMSIEDYTKMLDKAHRNDNSHNVPPVKSASWGTHAGPYYNAYNSNIQKDKMYLEEAADGNLIFKPDRWMYRNENMMNGGSINGPGLQGLTGVDPNYDGKYAVYLH